MLDRTSLPRVADALGSVIRLAPSADFGSKGASVRLDKWAQSKKTE